MDPISILIADDEEKSVGTVKRVLESQGWKIDSAPNGKAALQKLLERPYQAVLTDLSMPEMNGMELVSCMKSQLDYQPLVLMFSAYFEESIKERAKQMGVYRCLSKPVNFKELSQVFIKGLKEINPGQTVPGERETNKEGYEQGLPDFGALGIAVSTGGPQTLKTFFQQLPSDFPLPILIVIHSPDWAIQTLIQSFNKQFSFSFQIAKQGHIPEAGNVYFAPSGFNMELMPGPGAIHLHQDSMENFVRPAADPLFRSMARTLGSQAIGLIMSGLGKDGSLGTLELGKANATVLIQSPDSSTAPFMPRAALDVNPDLTAIPLRDMARTAYVHAQKLISKLPKKTKPAGDPVSTWEPR